MGKKRRSRQFKDSSKVINIEEARKQRMERRLAEKEKEEEQLRYAASQKTRGKMAIRKSRNRRRFMVGLIAVLVIAAMVLSVGNVISLKKEQREIMQQTKELEAEKAQLEKELSQINDPSNIEEQARDQLRLVKPGEILYMFPEEEQAENAEESQNTKGD